MRRLLRRAPIALLLILGALTLQLGSATTASAATTCKFYDGFTTDSGQLLRNINLCAAPASDFPNYSGWGRVVQVYGIHPDVCSFSLFPYDIDDPQPAVACIAMMPAPISAWRWTGSTWQAVSSEAFLPGSKAYFAPYAAGWRWAWTQQTGWVALQEKHAAFRWS